MFAAGKAASGAEPTDAQFNYVTMLLHGNGTNGAQNNTFVDSSTNNFTITRNGNTTQGTFTPYGSNWSNYFNGSSGVTVSSTSSQFGFAGDFTWEAWINPSALPSSGGNYSIICSRGTTASNSAFQFLFGNSSGTYQITGTISISSSDSNLVWNISSTPSIGTWYHVAIVRSGTSVQAYWNGTAIGSAQTASGTTNTPTVNPTIGFRGGSYNDLFFNGYISNFRMVGSAVYTSNFTPSTTPLTAISGTRLLTCADNRFIDDSTNAFSLSAYSSPSVQRFSPFSPTTAYSTSVIGGSGYFDGSGDYLTVPSNSAFDFDSGAFTIEMWVFPLSHPSETLPISRVYDPAFNYSFAAYFTSGVVNFLYNGLTTISTSTTLALNAWSHIAYVRSGTTLTIYINGVSAGSGTISGSITASSYAVGVGARYNGAFPFNGYISNVRLVKGTAVYTSAFTPPTTPLTAITNTSLLLNYTNAGILDNAMMNDLETVGNAQISTSVKKYGTGSMSFDGTGDGLIANGVSSSGAYNKLTASGVVNTVEFWLYVNSFTSPRAFLCGSWASSVGWTYDVNTSGDIFIATDGSGPTVTLSSKITTGAWQHLAFVNDGTNIKIYLNGTNVGTQAVAAPSSYVGPLTVGLRSDSSLPLNGYIDDLRITKGYARYTANFTAPTAAFADKG